MRVEGAHEGGPAQIVTESQNISASGIYCTSSHFLPPLSKVMLTIVLPKMPGQKRGQELIKTEGIVVRCDATPGRKPEARYQLACMFADIDPERRERIEEFVAWRNLQALHAALMPARRKTTTTKKAAVRKATRPPRERPLARHGPPTTTGAPPAK
ncbi:MAG: PilZ domain-containing protein [Candidatus Eisenbacteria bacterium]|nr:PilZ domain-containing protein [Candidatus Eisenbacteria bacterium]